MLKLNDNNIYVGHIKQVLKDFNLPRCNVLTKDTIIHPYTHYIDSNHIYYCDYKGENYRYSREDLKQIDVYKFNDKIFNLTDNLNITNLIYDSYTHQYLGNYLRFIRDFYKIDLMSLFNCCDGTLVKSHSLNLEIILQSDKQRDSIETTPVVSTIFDSSNNSFIIYAVPVKFHSKYSIGIDCNNIEMFCGLYSNSRFIEDSVDENILEEFYKNSYYCARSCSLDKPVLYNKLQNINDNLFLQEGSLTLFIKVPASCKSSLVVLEGDYTDTQVKFADNHSINSLIKYRPYDVRTNRNLDVIWGGNYSYKSKKELLSHKNAYSQYLVADRLLEYLSENTITSISEKFDVEKLQRKLISLGYLKSAQLGLWTEETKKSIYNLINEYHLNSKEYDILSYVDKGVESKLGYMDEIYEREFSTYESSN